MKGAALIKSRSAVAFSPIFKAKVVRAIAKASTFVNSHVVGCTVSIAQRSSSIGFSVASKIVVPADRRIYRRGELVVLVETQTTSSTAGLCSIPSTGHVAIRQTHDVARRIQSITAVALSSKFHTKELVR